MAQAGSIDARRTAKTLLVSASPLELLVGPEDQLQQFTRALAVVALVLTPIFIVASGFVPRNDRYDVPAFVACGLSIACAVLAWATPRRLVRPAFVALIVTMAAAGTMFACDVRNAYGEPVISSLVVGGGAAAFCFLPRRWAVGLAATGAGMYAVHLALASDETHKIVRWWMVVMLLVALAAVMSWFVTRVALIAADARQAHADLGLLNAELERRVALQVEELDRLRQLRRFLPPAVVDLVLAASQESLLEPHTRDIAVLFCDLRSFTAFSAAHPDAVHGVLAEYFAALGESTEAFGATVSELTGDGLMAFFNDPLPIDDPVGQAVGAVLDMAGRVQPLLARWASLGYGLGFGAGIAYGPASIGLVGVEGRRDYTANGPVVNMAARLCGEARSGELVLDERAVEAAGPTLPATELRRLGLKGYPAPIDAHVIAMGDVGAVHRSEAW